MSACRPERQVDGEDRGGAGVHRRDERGGGAGDLAVEAGAEEGVDDERGRRAAAGRPGRWGRASGRRRWRRRRLRRAGSPRSATRDLAAGGHEAAGGDEAVAAVVAGAGEDEDRAVGGERGGGVGHGAAGGLHQRHAGGAGGDGEAVGLGHLGGGEELVHAQRPESACWMRRYSAMFSRSTMPARRPARVMQTRRASRGLDGLEERGERGGDVGGAGRRHHLGDPARGAEVAQAAQERGLGQDAGDALAVEDGEVLLGAGEGEVDRVRQRVAGASIWKSVIIARPAGWRARRSSAATAPASAPAPIQTKTAIRIRNGLPIRPEDAEADGEPLADAGGERGWRAPGPCAARAPRAAPGRRPSGRRAGG